MKTRRLSVIELLEHQFLPLAHHRKYACNMWLEDTYMNVYVRRSWHQITDIDEVVQALDIATISVKPTYQRKGYFKRFLIQAHDLNPWRATYVENVCNSFLAAWFERQPDWKTTNDNPFSKCFYKLKDHG